MSTERDAVIEAGARALYEERRDKSAPSDHWPDFDDIGNGGKVFFLGLAAAAYDAALPMFVGPLRELAELRTALRREIGPPTDRDEKWQPMVSAGEIRKLLDFLDALPGATS